MTACATGVLLQVLQQESVLPSLPPPRRCHFHPPMFRSLFASANVTSSRVTGETIKSYCLGSADLALNVLGEFKDSIPIPAVGLLITGTIKILEIAKV